MIEAYAFLAMFAVQILAVSVVLPAWLSKQFRVMKARYEHDERFTRLYTDAERASLERNMTIYRAASTCIAVFGAVVLWWLFRYTQNPRWDEGAAGAVAAGYFMLQTFPCCLLALASLGFNKKAFDRWSPAAKRTAVLQRRRLFDFVSPLTVLLAALGYCLFAAYMFYIEQHPFPGFAGPFVNIGALTLLYAVNAFVVYTMVYRKKTVLKNPLQSRGDQMHLTRLTVKISVYSCIIITVFMSLSLTLSLLDMKIWSPFSQSLLFVVCTLLSSAGLVAPPRQPEPDGLGSSPAP